MAYDNGAGLLEKLNLLGRRKLMKMMPQAGAALGSTFGGPVGGAAGYAAGGTLEALMNSLSQGQQSPYAGTGMAPGMRGMESQGQQPFANRFAGNMGEFAGNALGDYATGGMSDWLSGIGAQGQKDEMSDEEIKEMLSKMSEEELMAYIQNKFGSQIGGNQ